MAENSISSPVFARRYKFQTVSDDWDKGRSGFTHLVFDIQKERLGVIKRAEIKSQQAVEGLKNEVAALLDLKGLGVPAVFDTGEAEYGSKNYFYVVMEYIEGIRIEKKLDSLSGLERADILTQFFGLLAKAHKMEIVNGDIDLKHLFWLKDKKQLIIIDWGNAKLDVDPKKKNEFAYDLARSAEIIYSLTTLKGHPSATGSIALPNDSSLIPGLAPLPVEFRNLCKWAPRTPNDGAQSPHTAQEMLDASKNWQKAIQNAKPYTPRRRPNWGLRVFFALVIVAVLFLGLSPNSPLYPLINPKTSTPTITASNTSSPTASETITPSKTALPSATSTDMLTPTVEPIITPSPAVTPAPGTYTNKILVLNQDSSFPNNCWVNTPPELKPGLARRDDGNWIFEVAKGTTTDQFIQADFSQCPDIQLVKAMAINVWIKRLELQRDLPEKPGTLEPGKEFGFFIETASGQRREYTIWMDVNKSMYLRIRENNEITLDEVVLVIDEINLKIVDAFPRLYAEFPIQIFFETNNNGLDIIYLRQGFSSAVKTDAIDPSQMITIHNGVRPNFGNIQTIGLIGYGGETKTVIWPLVFFGESQ